MYSQQFLERMKDKLNEERERLNEELEALNAHTEMGDDMDDNAQEVSVDEANQDIIAQLKADMEKIDESLAKIENGTYGVCTVGGEQISEERLEVIPWAETCTEHNA
ncbi:MAG TPA: TraR/DksA C4-type zinc finger protein [Patescibacteria group bacterium]